MRSENTIQSRIFLVGCPRSGTTLLQSMLASHGDIVSFPETHFLGSLAPRPWWRPAPIIPDIAEAQKRFEQTAELVGIPEFAAEAPKDTRLKKRWMQSFFRMLDEAARRNEGKIWIEKTPEHISFASMIRRYCGDAKFIHIVRDGPSVVASLVDVTRKHPEHWGGEWDVEFAVSVWNRAIRKHRRYKDLDGHFVVRYENLAKNPERVLKLLCSALSIDYEESMVTALAAKDLIVPEEAWKSSVRGGTRGVAQSKFDKVLSEEEKKHVLDRIDPGDDIMGIADART